MKKYGLTFLIVWLSLTCCMAQDTLSVCSFNIKFIGFYKKKDHQALADLLKDYDLVLIQELVSPPVSGTYPDGTVYEADDEASEFATGMRNLGFEYILSNEDTGTNDEIHNMGSATEWFIVFYKPDRIQVDSSLITGFIAMDRSNHPSYERVPHAFSFETMDGGLDLTLISVHLQPGSSVKEKARRKEELSNIDQWIQAHQSLDKDYLIVGDMNLYSQEELQNVLPAGYQSLNDACRGTNLDGSKPYDHVMYRINDTGTDLLDTLVIIDLLEAMRSRWAGPGPYPENNNNLYYQYYSDHQPIVFYLVSDGEDDD